MSTIKNFFYLDDDKMFSISSQIFEGMTEYIVKNSSQRESETDQQKGFLGSGRIMADVIELQKDQTEKTFLHDYSYTLFENELISRNKVLEISSNNLKEKLIDVSKYKFVKISGRIVFNDTLQLENVVSTFNDIGYAVTYITNHGKMEEEKKTFEKQVGDIKDRNQRSNMQKMMKSTFDLKKLARENSMNLDEEYLKHLKFILNYGYSGQFEIQMPFLLDEGIKLFSAILKRDKLKESEITIVKKHGRITEQEFTIFGILTQTNANVEKLPLFNVNENGDSAQDVGMKEMLMQIISPMTEFEKVFTGKLNYEFVIDPLAIYQEI